MNLIHQFGDSIARHLDIVIERPELYFQAFSHPSYVHEKKSDISHYQRLEFLGDAVLELVITELLYTNFTNQKEGSLSKMRSKIVNENTLAEISRSIDLGHYILLGKGEEHTNGRDKNSILSDVFESLVGALYLDKGIETAKDFIINSLNFYLEQSKLTLLDLSTDYKSILQEEIMKEYKLTPVYQSSEVEDGYYVELKVGSKTVGSRTSHSKKEAQKLIAKELLNNKEKLFQSLKEIK